MICWVQSRQFPGTKILTISSFWLLKSRIIKIIKPPDSRMGIRRFNLLPARPVDGKLVCSTQIRVSIVYIADLFRWNVSVSIKNVYRLLMTGMGRGNRSRSKIICFVREIQIAVSAAGTELHPAIQERIHLGRKLDIRTFESALIQHCSGIGTTDIFAAADVAVRIAVTGV